MSTNYKTSMRLEKITASLIICILFLASLTSNAQQTIAASDENQIIFKHNHITLEYARLLSNKARISRQSGDYPMSSATAWSDKLGILYHINISTHTSIITGAEATVSAANFVTTLYKTDFSPSLDRDYHFTNSRNLASTLLLSMPVIIEKRFWYNKRNFFSAEAGVRLNIGTQTGAVGLGYGAKNSSDSIITPINFNLTMNNNGKPWISYLLNVAHSWLLGNNNYLQLGIGTNLSFTKYISGTWRINVPNKPVTTGNYSSTGTYNQLFVRYTFTGANHRLKKQVHS